MGQRKIVGLRGEKTWFARLDTSEVLDSRTARTLYPKLANHIEQLDSWADELVEGRVCQLVCLICLAVCLHG